MADRQISHPQAVPAPSDYVVPAAATFILKAVNADFTDNGAGADWLPCVTLIANSGQVIARAADQGVKVTAGSNAEVSWFPGVKHSASAGAGATAHYCKVILGPSTPSGSIALGNGTLMPIIEFDTDTPADYVQVDANTWKIPQVPQNISGDVVVDGGAQTTLNGDVNVVAKSGGHFPFGVFAPNGSSFLIDWYSYNLSQNIELQNNWQAFAVGADTHNFDITVTYLSVY